MREKVLKQSSKQSLKNVLKIEPEDFIQATKGLMQAGGLYKDIDNNG